MPADLTSLYAALAEDVDSAGLPSAESLRRRGDRRTYAVAVVACVAVLIALAGVEVGIGPWGRHSVPNPGASVGSPSSAPTSVVSIPDAAFFAPPGAGALPDPVDGDASLPSLCGARFASDSAIQDRRHRTVPYRSDESASGNVTQTITRYRAGQAAVFMRQLRAAVTSCQADGPTAHPVTFQSLVATPRGDDALLFQQIKAASDGSPTTELFSVIRVGDVATVLRVSGDAGQSADASVADDFSDRAVSAILAWLN